MVGSAVLDTLNPQFIYDAIRKVGTGRGKSAEGHEIVIEFLARHGDDSMDIKVEGPDISKKLTVKEDDFQFSDNKVSLQGLDGVVMFMHPVYLKKMQGFTRGNVPTPVIAGETLP